MKIQSPRTRQDLQIAAELRAAGASWDTIAAQLHRQPTLLARWARFYVDEWQRMLAEAEQRQARQENAESRSAIRSLLRSKELKTRLDAAGNLARQLLDEKKETTEVPADLFSNPAALNAYVEKLSEEELDRFINETLNKKGNG
jgi:hypothetical protein